MRKRDPHPKKRKAIKLTRHATTMDLVIEFPGDRVVPRQRFGPISQLFVSAASEEGAKTILSHRQVPQGLQHVKQNCNWYRVQHNRLELTHHLDQHNRSKWNEPNLMRVGFYRRVERT